MLKVTKTLLVCGLLMVSVSTPVMALTLDAQSHWSKALMSQIETRFESRLELVQSGDLRSRSDVIREVKQKYDAEVLRIELDSKRKFYKVRILMPNGKVRNLTINARR